MSELFVVHMPIAPPRAGTPGEGIYLKLWQDFATDRPDDWLDIFRNMTDQADQRVASVAASFMVFMGCNGGSSFTYLADSYRPKFSTGREAFVAAWAIYNYRSRGTNHGLRTSEYMLAAQHPISKVETSFKADVMWSCVPEIAQKDNDTLECMAEWWSTGPAERMREIAEAMISVERKKAMSNLFAPKSTATVE